MSSNYSCRPIVSNRRVKIVVTYQPTCSAAKRVRRFTALRRHPLPEPVSIPSCYSLYTLIGRVLNCLNQIPLSHVSRYAILKTVATHTRARARKGLSRNIIPLHAFSVLLTKGLKFETKNDFSMEKKQESRRPVWPFTSIRSEFPISVPEIDNCWGWCVQCSSADCARECVYKLELSRTSFISIFFICFFYFLQFIFMQPLMGRWGTRPTRYAPGHTTCCSAPKICWKLIDWPSAILVNSPSSYWR